MVNQRPLQLDAQPQSISPDAKQIHDRPTGDRPHLTKQLPCFYSWRAYLEVEATNPFLGLIAPLRFHQLQSTLVSDSGLLNHSESTVSIYNE